MRRTANESDECEWRARTTPQRLESYEMTKPKVDMFKNEPTCEACGKNPASAFSYRAPEHEGDKGAGWRFTCDCTDDHEDYPIHFTRPDGCGFFDSSDQTVDWLAHMGEKTWMDWQDFHKMMVRLRSAITRRRS